MCQWRALFQSYVVTRFVRRVSPYAIEFALSGLVVYRIISFYLLTREGSVTCCAQAVGFGTTSSFGSFFITPV